MKGGNESGTSPRVSESQLRFRNITGFPRQGWSETKVEDGDVGTSEERSG